MRTHSQFFHDEVGPMSDIVFVGCNPRTLPSCASREPKLVTSSYMSISSASVGVTRSSLRHANQGFD